MFSLEGCPVLIIAHTLVLIPVAWPGIICFHRNLLTLGGLPAGFCAGWWIQLCLSCVFKATDCFDSFKLDFLRDERIKGDI